MLQTFKRTAAVAAVLCTTTIAAQACPTCGMLNGVSADGIDATAIASVQPILGADVVSTDARDTVAKATVVAIDFGTLSTEGLLIQDKN